MLYKMILKLFCMIYNKIHQKQFSNIIFVCKRKEPSFDIGNAQRGGTASHIAFSVSIIYFIYSSLENSDLEMLKVFCNFQPYTILPLVIFLGFYLSNCECQGFF